ncbi:MAG: family 16 glycosylhydrolase [Chloroflexi bacterium]|nr:family 16 glycosylhydrolase [Chloroflexota bacterium]
MTSEIILQATLQGTGKVETVDQSRFKLILPMQKKTYSNAQLDDYVSLPRNQFKWRPPLHFEIQARTTLAQPTGTLGFGFWNDPFTFSSGQEGAARRIPAAPQTLWFFHSSPENNICLVPGVPGNGWKAASLRTPNLHPIILAPLAGIALAMSNVPILGKRVHRIITNIAKSSESVLSFPLNEWHTYTIEWTTTIAQFFVDGVLVLQSDQPPVGPLGFVTWIDNQYAVFSSSQGLRFGILATSSEQELEVKNIKIEPLPHSAHLQ